MWLKSLFAIFIAIIIIITSSPKDVSAAAGEYPEGTVSFVGNSARSLTVKAGQSRLTLVTDDKGCARYPT